MVMRMKIGRRSKPCNHVIRICKDCWENRLNHLKLDPPLAMAKFFYKKGIDDVAIIQRLIYLVYFKMLKEKWILLFEEKFQARPGGPVLKSIFNVLNENYERLEDFFNGVEDISNEVILQYLESMAKRYSELGNVRVYKNTQNNAWKSARKKIEEEDFTKPIEKDDIIPFVQWESNKERKAIRI